MPAQVVSASVLPGNVMGIVIVMMVATRHTQLAEINQETVMEIYSGVIVASASILPGNVMEIVIVEMVVMKLPKNVATIAL